MWSCVVVPVLEVFCCLERVSVSFVGVEPFFDFAVGLWVFGSTTYVLCSLLLEVLFELAAV